MCRIVSNVDRRDQIDHEIDDVLPVVDARGIGIPYAAGIVDYERYVQQTLCNMCYHTICVLAQFNGIIHVYVIQAENTSAGTTKYYAFHSRVSEMIHIRKAIFIHFLSSDVNC